MRLLLVGVGGFVGSVLRYLLSGLVHEVAPRTSFPIGTLAVNVAGCFVIGVVAELAETRGFLGPDSRALLVVGVLGGFTTFSSFANETVNAARDGAPLVALLNVMLTLVLCLSAVMAGRTLANLVWR